jgi:hypothetical protein
MFLRPAYTEDDIAQLPDSDGDNEIVDKYDEMTRNGTVQLERGPFQNYVVSIFFTSIVFELETTIRKGLVIIIRKRICGSNIFVPSIH